MEKYDSKRILTVHEMHKGDQLHGGMLAGKCVAWSVLEIRGQDAFIKVGSTVAVCTGKDLREMPFYFSENCPMCQLQHEVKPSAIPELHAIPREILSANFPSSFRFRAAQYGREKKTR